jgi:hypothetical protein
MNNVSIKIKQKINTYQAVASGFDAFHRIIRKKFGRAACFTARKPPKAGAF